MVKIKSGFGFDPLKILKQPPEKTIKEAATTPSVTPVGGVVKSALKIGVPLTAGAILGRFFLGGGSQEPTVTTTQTPKQTTDAKQTVMPNITLNPSQTTNTYRYDRSRTITTQTFQILNSPYASLTGSATIPSYDIIDPYQGSGVAVSPSQGIAPNQETTAKGTASAFSMDSSGLMLIAAALGGLYLLTRKR